MSFEYVSGPREGAGLKEGLKIKRGGVLVEERLGTLGEKSTFIYLV